MVDFKDLFKNFGNSDENFKNYSDKDRIKLLDLNDEDVIRIENSKIHKVDYCDNDYEGIRFEEILLDRLVGINRGDAADNWLEQLFKLHKQTCFNYIDNGFSFADYAQSLNEESYDLPNVIEDGDGKYYINGGGKHRLTIAKCLQLETFPVRVIKLKSN